MFSIYSPYVFSYTGLAYTGAIPADIASFQVPSSGQGYAFSNFLMTAVAGTGDLGSLNFTYVLNTAPEGSGFAVAGWIATSSIPVGRTRIVNYTVTGHTPSDTTGLYLRVTNNTPSISGLTIRLSANMQRVT